MGCCSAGGRPVICQQRTRLISTRHRARDRLAEAKHGIFPPERVFLCLPKGEKFVKYTNQSKTAPTGIGNRTVGTRGVRSRPCASARVVDAALVIEQSDDSMKRGCYGTALECR